MNNLSHKPASKLLAMVDKVVVSNRKAKNVFQRAQHSEEEKRAYGVLNSDIEQLQESAEHFRKAGDR